MPLTANPGRTRFLRSALSEDNPFCSTAEASAWLHSTGAATALQVRRIPLAELGEWSFEPGTGDLVHRTGKFFRVHGLRAQTDLPQIRTWEQPIIDQPEIGILGIIVREMGDQLYLLMQAKMEPGNPHGVQLVPTVQATRSNYTQVHQGARPRFVEYFLESGLARVLVDQLQFEQGSAFLRKRNRNVVIEVEEDLPAPENYRWLTLGQVKRLLGEPSLVSMDTRTVVSCIPLVNPLAPDGVISRRPDVEWPAALLHSLASPNALHSDDELLAWLTQLKCQHHLALERVGLRGLEGWRIGEAAIEHVEGRFFQVVAVQVEAESREVARWSQPLVASVERGLVGFLATRIEGLVHFLVQARAEPGSADTLILGPTVQCALGPERLADRASWPPFCSLIADPPPGSVRFSQVQSEEGGRFYQVESEYRIVEVEEGARLELPPNYRWATLRQLQDLLRFGLVSVEARSLLACLDLSGPSLAPSPG